MEKSAATFVEIMNNDKILDEIREQIKIYDHDKADHFFAQRFKTSDGRTRVILSNSFLKKYPKLLAAVKYDISPQLSTDMTNLIFNAGFIFGYKEGFPQIFHVKPTHSSLQHIIELGQKIRKQIKHTLSELSDS